MNQKVVDINSKPCLSEIENFSTSPLKNQFCLVLKHFGYRESEIAEAFNCSIKEVEDMLKVIDPSDKIRVTIANQLGKWYSIKSSCESAITPEKLKNESPLTLVKIASIAEIHIQNLEAKAKNNQRLLLPEDLKDNLIKLLPEGK